MKFLWKETTITVYKGITLVYKGINSVRYGTEKVSFLAPKIWDILPKDMKDSESLDIVKRKIPWECSRKRCKTYVLQVGFISVLKIKGTYHLLS